MNINNTQTTQAKDELGISNPKIISKSFTDVEHFKEFYRRHEIIQLTPGSLEASFLSIQLGNLYVLCHQTNPGVQAFGKLRKEYIPFGLLWSENEKEYYSLRHSVKPQRTLFGFDNREADFICPQGGTFTNILIPVQTFDTYADQLQRHDLNDSFRRKNHVNLLPTGMQEIKDYLKQLIWLAVHQPTLLQQSHLEKLVLDDFLPLLISNIPIKRNSKCFFKPSRRAKLISQAEKEMLAHLKKPLTLQQLAQNLGSSSSALSYGFQDLFGISPMRYLKVQRLNAVRQHLKAREPESCGIATLANQFGFYDKGHFARDYKAMFGELPSQTLRNTAKVSVGV